jgi:hypothetical protein
LLTTATISIGSCASAIALEIAAAPGQQHDDAAGHG